MVNSNVDALGILFPNSYDSFVPELVAERSMASIPFAGRYRMVDFLLSSMVTAGSTISPLSCVRITILLWTTWALAASGTWCGRTEASISFLPMRKST